MKSVAYKKTGNGIEKINNDFDKLDNKSPESTLMTVYEDLFNKIDKGSSVLMKVKTSEYKDSLIDSLQSVMVKVLADKSYLDIRDMNVFLRKCLMNRFLDMVKTESRHNIFKTDNLELIVESKESGITENYINQCIMEIKNILTETEYKIFRLYHIKGYTIKEIENKIDMAHGTVYNLIQKVNNRIDKLKIAYLYENRYLSYDSHKKKRQHKRKVLTRKEIIEKSGVPHRISQEVYADSQVVVNQESIPFNKCLSYPTKQYYKVSSNDSNQIADMGLNSGKTEYLIDSMTYGNAKILPLTSKKVNYNEVIDW